MKKQTLRKMIYSGLLIAFGVLFPQLFHIFGPQAGQTFLPMHIPVIPVSYTHLFCVSMTTARQLSF